MLKDKSRSFTTFRMTNLPRPMAWAGITHPLALGVFLSGEVLVVEVKAEESGAFSVCVGSRKMRNAVDQGRQNSIGKQVGEHDRCACGALR